MRCDRVVPARANVTLWRYDGRVVSSAIFQYTIDVHVRVKAADR
jgi:hypothetical protein